METHPGERRSVIWDSMYMMLRSESRDSPEQCRTQCPLDFKVASVRRIMISFVCIAERRNYLIRIFPFRYLTLSDHIHQTNHSSDCNGLCVHWNCDSGLKGSRINVVVGDCHSLVKHKEPHNKISPKGSSPESR